MPKPNVGITGGTWGVRRVPRGLNEGAIEVYTTLKDVSGEKFEASIALFNGGSSRAVGNAALFAAAPDLLKAIEQVRDGLHDAVVGALSHDAAARLLAVAENAMAKAWKEV